MPDKKDTETSTTKAAAKRGDKKSNKKTSSDSVKYKNSTGTYTLQGGVLSDKKGKRVQANKVSTTADPLRKVGAE